MKSSPKSHTAKPFLCGLFLGVAAGAAVGLLFAPHAGAETRRQLQGRLGQTQGRAQQFAAEGLGQSQSAGQSFKKVILSKFHLLMQAIDAGKRAAQDKHQQLTNEDMQGVVNG